MIDLEHHYDLFLINQEKDYDRIPVLLDDSVQYKTLVADGRIYAVKMESKYKGNEITLEDAIEKGYIIVVSYSKFARELNKRYKSGEFASINSSPCRFDGVKGIFIDKYLLGHERAIELQKYHMNVFIGDLYLKQPKLR